MHWHNEPPAWHEQADQLWLKTALKTDFWRKTHYGFIRDSGHFYGQEITGDFVAKVKVTGRYEQLYDQAGLMVRADEQTWLKCGVEFVEGVQYASAVVTRDRSDWSVAPLVGQPPHLWLSVERTAETIAIQYSLDGQHYQLLRIADFVAPDSLWVGPMAASPEREGFEATFEAFSLQPSP